MTTARVVPIGVFLIVWLSSAYVWQARDWNGSSRLMLTYALVDRGQVSINGLEDHTRDRARLRRRYYSDKLPGFSLLAIPSYLFARHVVGVPPHPLDRRGAGFTHWPADYWIAVGTSGLATGLTAALLAWFALRAGCGPGRAVLVGLGYGLATPAYVYATLSYGHQATAALLLGSFLLAWARPSRRAAAGAGFLAAMAAVVELQVAPVAAVIGAYLVVLTASRRRPRGTPAAFALGAVGPLLILAAYNTLAFGSPLDMGYFHEDLPQFRNVHNAANPLGLRGPDLGKLIPLLWGEHRGLLFFAPILFLSPFGWVVLARRRWWGVFGVSLASCAVVLLVNLSYPEWTGGWSTGPRLLLPLIPFAMLPVAALLGRSGNGVTALATVLVGVGAGVMLLFLGAGGRVPPEFIDPLHDFVQPAWRNGDFARNLAALVLPNAVRGLPARWAWLQWMPLVAFQVAAALLLVSLARRRAAAEAQAAGSSAPPS
jgi:hypothetical protein